VAASQAGANVIVYAVVDNALSPDFPLGVELAVAVEAAGSEIVLTIGLDDEVAARVEADPEYAEKVAGEVTEAEGIAVAQVALRRVFDGFTLHRTDAPDAPGRVNAELMVGASYVLEPQVAEEARLGTMPAGTPVVTRSPLSLAQDNSRPSRPGRNNRSGSRPGTAGGSPRRSRTAPPRRSRS
jgi:hypothetical protein